MSTEYLNDSIQIVMNNLDKLPDKAIDELYFRIWTIVQERNLGEYTDFEEVE